MDSDEWQKAFPVLSISRAFLETLGFPPELVTELTDADMLHIAHLLQAEFSQEFQGETRFITSITHVEKQFAIQERSDTYGSQEPMQQNRETRTGI